MPAPSNNHPLPMGGGRVGLARWSATEAIHAADWTLSRLEQLGVGMPTPSRLVAARDLLRQANTFAVQYDTPRSPTALAVSEAIKTAFEQYLIVRDLNFVDALAKKRLRLMQKGDALPMTTADDPGRDVQAEFLAGVVFRAAGYRVDLAEPDLLLSRGARRWGVAVKRVKSNNQFKTRVRRAQCQLAGQNLFGFIVVNPEIYIGELLAQGLSGERVSAALYNKLAEWADYVDDQRPSNRVLAVMALATGFTLRKRARGAFQFEFGLYIHQQYVTDGSPTEIAAVRAIGAAMYCAINQTLVRAAHAP